MRMSSEIGFEPTYENLKELANELRQRLRDETGDGRAKLDVNEVLALDKTNDPFYFGTPAQVAMGKWFRDIWEEKGYSGGKHIRRIHYEISTESHKQYYRHDGTPYINDEDSRLNLQKACTASRHLGYIEASDFSDMRLKAGVKEFRGLPRFEHESTESGFEREEDAGLKWEYPKVTFEGGEASYELPEYVATGYDYADDDQPYRLEAWFEKEIGTKALEPVCRNLQVHLLIGVGNISVTQADLILQRSVEDERPTRILYFADFDAAGHGMPVSVARQIEYLIRTKYSSVENIAMHRIAVTPEQIGGDNP